MSIYLGVRLDWNSITILSVCNRLYNSYYIFKKESKYVVVIKKEKDTIENKSEICAYNNMSKKSPQSN